MPHAAKRRCGTFPTADRTATHHSRHLHGTTPPVYPNALSLETWKFSPYPKNGGHTLPVAHGRHRPRAQPNLFEQPDEITALSIGTVHGWHSRALDEYRELNIYTPAGYHPDSALTYPVIYLLDGSVNEDFLHIAGILQFMDMMDLFPPHILVGIANTNRRRDFTYPSTDTGDLKLIPNGAAPKNSLNT